MTRRITVGSTFALFTIATTSAALTPPGQSVVDARGTTMASSAPYGRALNGLSFQGHALTSLNGYQYAAYWVTVPAAGTTTRPATTATPAAVPTLTHVAVARRKLPDGPWQVIDLPESAFKNGVARGTRDPIDAHNTVSIAIAPGDGTIHLAYDHHNNDLRYRVTAPGVATRPEAARWDASVFQPERSQLAADRGPVKQVCYPYFERTPAGGLQLFMRRGQSGRGSWWAYDYDAAAHRWTDGWQYDDGLAGVYQGSTPPSAARCAYPNAWTYGPDGKLHVTWTYREDFGTGLGGFANHDICYAYSEDRGATWKNNAGAPIADRARDSRITIDSPGIVVVPLSQESSLINTQAQAVDSKGRIHVLMYHLDPSKTRPTTRPAAWRTTESSYFHHWRDDDGTWREAPLPAVVGSRPKLAFDADDNALAVFASGTTAGIYQNDRDLIVARATRAGHWADWAIVATAPGPFVSEPLIDADRLRAGGVLSVVMQDAPTAERQPTSIRVFDFDVSALSATRP